MSYLERSSSLNMAQNKKSKTEKYILYIQLKRKISKEITGNRCSNQSHLKFQHLNSLMIKKSMLIFSVETTNILKK